MITERRGGREPAVGVSCVCNIDECTCVAMCDGLGCAGAAVNTGEGRRLGDDASTFGDHQSITHIADRNRHRCTQCNDHRNERCDTPFVCVGH